MDETTLRRDDPYAAAPAPKAGAGLFLPASIFILFALISAIVRQYREVTVPIMVAGAVWLGWLLLKRK
ncbi:MAG TPA: hypothetical protein VII13_15570 [Vicinamibacteria bacterium]|jgi:hypothetical protein